MSAYNPVVPLSEFDLKANVNDSPHKFVFQMKVQRRGYPVLARHRGHPSMTQSHHLQCNICFVKCLALQNRNLTLKSKQKHLKTRSFVERETSAFSQSVLYRDMSTFNFNFFNVHFVCLFICFGIAVIIINKCEHNRVQIMNFTDRCQINLAMILKHFHVFAKININFEHLIIYICKGFSNFLKQHTKINPIFFSFFLMPEKC